MLQAKKKFSQNFLVDQNLRDKVLIIMSKIVALNPKLELIEIGPGAGDLTKQVVEWRDLYTRYTALEIDPDAVEFLEDLGLKSENYPNFELVYCDAWKSLLGTKATHLSKGVKVEDFGGISNQTVILSGNASGTWVSQVKPSPRRAKDPMLIDGKTSTVIQSVAKDPLLRITENNKIQNTNSQKPFPKPHLQSYTYPTQFNLISSLPYAIGSRIMVDLGVINPSTNFAVILQKEVATKCVPNPKNFNMFGAWLNLFWHTKVELILPPHAFNPQPKVHSAVLTGIYYQNQILKEHLQTQESRDKVKNILKTLFGQPSKTLYNNLKKLNWTKPQIEELYNKNNLDKNLRLDWGNYEEVLRLIVADQDL
jgi:16S rRNA A1518/A1519 N6-dimethyltransferase RsmA/KsgA/DIM1 with predicted DNA glycosylase/AP lyase activity